MNDTKKDYSVFPGYSDSSIIDRRKVLLCLLLAALTMGIFWQTGTYEFINFDDDLYVTDNYHVKLGLARESISWAFTTFHAANWHPLTWLSHMADVEMYGLTPKWHHITNVILHAANALLIFLILSRASGNLLRSFLVAVLFALHPLHVESVAWISERKDVLSTFFGFIAILVYLGFTSKRNMRNYFFLLAFFALSLMAKPMFVTLPFLLLLLDYWPLQRFYRQQARTILLEKLPLVVLSIIAGVVTWRAQDFGDALSSAADNPLSISIPNALVSYTVYLKKTFLPFDLAVFYPHPLDTIPAWKTIIAGIILFGITFVVVQYRKRFPYLVTGWFCYFVSLLPVIGIIRIGAHAYADRYTYVPLIGVFVIMVWGLADFAARRQINRVIPIGACVVTITLLALLTWKQTGYWKNSITLFERTLAVTDGNWLMHNNLGAALLAQERLDEANLHIEKALAIRSNYETALYNMGRLMEKLGQDDAALWHYNRSISSNPKYYPSYLALVRLYAKKSDFKGAHEMVAKALGHIQYNAQLHYYNGLVLQRLNNRAEAIEEYKRSIDLNIFLPAAYRELAILLTAEGRTLEAQDVVAKLSKVDNKEAIKLADKIKQRSTIDYLQ